MERNYDFTNGKILRPLLGFALPVLMALFLQSLYGAADLLIVGKFAQTADVSGVSTGSQIMMLVTNMLTGLSMGSTILLGQMIGQGKKSEGGKVVGAGICFFAVIGMVLSFLLCIFAKQLSILMQAPAEALAETTAYTRICGTGCIIIMAYNLIGSIFRGIGDSRTPLISVAIACVFNITGDLLLVAVFDMGAAGAAYATVTAQLLSVIISFFIIRKRQLPFEFRRSDLKFDSKITKRITGLGAPIALQDILVGLSFLVILAIVNNLGLTQSAGLGVAEKVCGFIMLVPSAFAQSLSAFVSQNFGAGKPDRAKRALLCGICSSEIVSLFMFWLSFFHGDLLAGIFSNDSEVIMQAADYLKAYAIDCLLTSVMFCFIGFFNGIGKTRFVMLQGISSAFGIRIPVSYLMSRTAGVNLFRIGIATPCSTFVQIIMCLICFKKTEKEFKGMFI